MKYEKEIQDLQEKITKLDWWLIKNLRSADFGKVSNERNNLFSRMEEIGEKQKRVIAGQNPLKTGPKTLYVNYNLIN